MSLAVQTKLAKLFEVLKLREMAGETGLLDVVLKATIDKAISADSQDQRLKKIEALCRTIAADPKSLIAIINKVLRDITTEKRQHIATQATTGEFKEYDNKDVQMLVRQYSSKTKRRIYDELSFVQKLYPFLARNGNTRQARGSSIYIKDTYNYLTVSLENENTLSIYFELDGGHNDNDANVHRLATNILAKFSPIRGIQFFDADEDEININVDNIDIIQEMKIPIPQGIESVAFAKQIVKDYIKVVKKTLHL
jgi:hypothetical protein